MNTLNIEAALAKKFKYRPLPCDLSSKYREYFFDNIPSFLKCDGGGALYTKCGSIVCSSYQRIVIGDYGAFVEFEKPANDFIIVPGQEYRVIDERYSKNVKYVWLTINDGSNIKIYHQRKGVSYADYKAGMYYISVHEVFEKE